MKVLHVIDSGGMYGAEVMLLNLAAEQKRQGLEPVIASIGDPHVAEKPLEAEALKRGIRVEKFRMRPGPNLVGGLELVRFARRGGFDLFHSHGYKGNILLGLWPSALRGIPVLTTLHGRTSVGRLDKMRWYQWADSLSLPFIEGVVLVHEAMRSQVWHHNLHVVNNGIAVTEGAEGEGGPEGEAPLDPETADFCRGGFTIGAIGRLSEEKGFVRLLQAMKQVLERRPDARLVMIGEGPQRRFLEAEALRLGIAGSVHLPGYLERASRYLPLFQAFALSSLTEGLPLVVLEAMRAGVPVVATRVGGVPELLQEGKAGVLVDLSGGPAALSQGIVRLIEEPGLGRDLARQARSALREKYSTVRMAAEYRSIYQGLLTGPPRCH